jgi:hypothetical protein
MVNKILWASFNFESFMQIRSLKMMKTYIKRHKFVMACCTVSNIEYNI